MFVTFTIYQFVMVLQRYLTGSFLIIEINETFPIYFKTILLWTKRILSSQTLVSHLEWVILKIFLT